MKFVIAFALIAAGFMGGAVFEEKMAAKGVPDLGPEHGCTVIQLENIGGDGR